jgi:heme-degrading monooxygenase HmoA
MVGRIWRGAVRPGDADEYAQYIVNTGVAGYRQTAGNLGVTMLRRELDDRVEFLILTLWESLEAVKAFAGEDYEKAVYYPEDDRYLIERDERTSHWQVDAHAEA